MEAAKSRNPPAPAVWVATARTARRQALNYTIPIIPIPA